MWPRGARPFKSIVQLVILRPTHFVPTPFVPTEQKSLDFFTAPVQICSCQLLKKRHYLSNKIIPSILGNKSLMTKVTPNIFFYPLMFLHHFKMLGSPMPRGSSRQKGVCWVSCFTNFLTTWNTLWRRRKVCGSNKESSIAKKSLRFGIYKGESALLMRQV